MNDSVEPKSSRFTLGALLCVVLAVALLGIVVRYATIAYTRHANVTLMKEHAEGIWQAEMSCVRDEEAGPSDRPIFYWPNQKNGRKFESSTEYFAWLMSDGNGQVATNVDAQVCDEMTPELLGGAGIGVAPTPAAFNSANNAWSVGVVEDATPSESPFLILRNVETGNMLCSTSHLTLSTSEPRLHVGDRVIWSSRGGSVFDCHFSRLTADRLSPTDLPPVAVLRP